MSFIVYEITPKKKRHYRLKKASIHSMPRLFTIFLEGIKKVKSAHDNMGLCEVEYIYIATLLLQIIITAKERRKRKRKKNSVCL